MSSLEARRKQRREYLKKKAIAHMVAGITGCLGVPCLVLAPSLVITLLIVLFDYLYHRKTPPFISLGVLSAVILFCGWTGWLLSRTAFRAHHKAEQLPYVPPVTANTLPAEEVLVRGSEQPAQEQSKVLLRGTDGCTGTGDQELLRSSQEQK